MSKKRSFDWAEFNDLLMSVGWMPWLLSAGAIISGFYLHNPFRIQLGTIGLMVVGFPTLVFFLYSRWRGGPEFWEATPTWYNNQVRLSTVWAVIFGLLFLEFVGLACLLLAMGANPALAGLAGAISLYVVWGLSNSLKGYKLYKKRALTDNRGPTLST